MQKIKKTILKSGITLLCFLIFSCSETKRVDISQKPDQALTTQKIIVNTNNAPTPIGSYSQAVMLKNTLFVSGQIAIDPSTNQVLHDDIEAETKLIMNNIQAILAQSGMGFENIVKTSIFLKNIDDFAKVDQIYGSYFTKDFPARETIQVSRLPKDVNVEISVIAAH
jgi:2-iminobutanoate/2-iminopropanoate deaminase